MTDPHPRRGNGGRGKLFQGYKVDGRVMGRKGGAGEGMYSSRWIRAILLSRPVFCIRER